MLIGNYCGTKEGGWGGGAQRPDGSTDVIQQGLPIKEVSASGLGLAYMCSSDSSLYLSFLTELHEAQVTTVTQLLFRNEDQYPYGLDLGVGGAWQGPPAQHH